MMRLTILYGPPADPEAFLSHYESTHVPLVHKMPGLASFTWGPCLPGPDGSGPPYFLNAELRFDDPAAMEEAFGSAEGQAALADTANLHAEMTTLTSEGR